jgi:hypothetical protein
MYMRDFWKNRDVDKNWTNPKIAPGGARIMSPLAGLGGGHIGMANQIAHGGDGIMWQLAGLG